MKIFRFLSAYFILPIFFLASNCKNTEKIVNQIHQNAINSDQSYLMLEYLSKQTPGRLPGTVQSGNAITYVEKKLKEFGADSVWLLNVNAPGWSELKKPKVEIELDKANYVKLNPVSLGQSVSTVEGGIKSQLVIINSREQIDSLGEDGLKGKIAFFNLKMKVRNDYGKMSWQRVQGASMVSRYGAIGVIVRSLTTLYDNNPHTGVVRYDEKYPKIPAIAISWQSADTLEKYLAKKPDLHVHMETFCNNPGLIPSYNVVGEIRGSKYPDEIYFLTAHLDAWHNAEGAQDDGGGVAQIVDVIRIFKELKIRPKHTIRIMAYMDEEQYLNGMIQYAEYMANGKKKHIFEIEVDNGLGIPGSFNIQADSVVFTKQELWRKYLAILNINDLKFSGSYAQDWPLYAKDSTILAHLICKDDHYFDYHHSANDVFETVNKLNLQSGSADLAAFIYILDRMEVIDNSKKEIVK